MKSTKTTFKDFQKQIKIRLNLCLNLLEKNSSTDHEESLKHLSKYRISIISSRAFSRIYDEKFIVLPPLL